MFRFNLPASRRVFLFLCVTALCLIIGSVICAIVLHGGMTPARVRLATIIQDVVIFIMPAIATAVLVTRLPADFLCLRGGISLKTILLVTATVIAAIPAMNMIIRWNESIELPQSLGMLEDIMKSQEENARAMIQALMGEPTVASLIMMFLVVGLLAGFSEELFFRGTLQRIISTAGINVHVAIWSAAAIFSIIHFQAYGFMPRLLLGAYFGYLVAWTGSLFPAIWAHVLNNVIAIGSLWSEARGSAYLESVPGFDEAYTGYVPAIISAVCVAFLLLLTVCSFKPVRLG